MSMQGSRAISQDMIDRGQQDTDTIRRAAGYAVDRYNDFVLGGMGEEQARRAAVASAVREHQPFVASLAAELSGPDLDLRAVDLAVSEDLTLTPAQSAYYRDTPRAELLARPPVELER